MAIAVSEKAMRLGSFSSDVLFILYPSMKINLVLSGGAVRGIAHIGVIKALEELGFEIVGVSGVSAGALVGAFYCAGYTPEEMLKIVKDREWIRYIKPRIPKLGFFSLLKGEKFLRKYLKVDRIEELKKEFHVCALDIITGKTIYFSEGDLYRIVLGSCALPGIFEPVRYKHFLLVDGGVTNNLPVEPFLKRDIPVVGVDVNPMDPADRPKNIVSILLRSFVLAIRSNVEKRKELCNFLIVPELGRYSLHNLWKVDEIYQLGYRKGLEVMKRFINEQ
ncbi:patatin-like phospholipase family protein [Thermocrinis jamiesonii]|uniref:patatin-like phospholipase family protein n=1 Tax=Thermocrinis jamiesonii TaxID=1302351 RepID=UPI001E5542F6|nr:patatin-like phospholipase family protein [Thermocrinis jamiesonii]